MTVVEPVKWGVKWPVDEAVIGDVEFGAHLENLAHEEMSQHGVIIPGTTKLEFVTALDAVWVEPEALPGRAMAYCSALLMPLGTPRSVVEALEGKL